MSFLTTCCVAFQTKLNGNKKERPSVLGSQKGYGIFIPTQNTISRLITRILKSTIIKDKLKVKFHLSPCSDPSPGPAT